MRELIGSLILTAASILLLTAQLSYAVHHDCSASPPLPPPKAFGWAVPIETICSLAGY